MNCGLGTSSNQLPSIVYTEKTYLFGLMLVDTCGVNNLQQVWNHNEFRELLIENNYGPAVRVNGGAVFSTDFVDTTFADYRGGAAVPIFDFTNTQTAGVRLIHPFCATGAQPAMQTGTGIYHGIEVNNTSAGCSLIGTNYAVVRDGNSNVDTYKNSQIAFSGESGRAYYLMNIPAAAQSAVVTAGGNVPVGIHSYPR